MFSFPFSEGGVAACAAAERREMMLTRPGAPPHPKKRKNDKHGIVTHIPMHRV